MKYGQLRGDNRKHVRPPEKISLSGVILVGEGGEVEEDVKDIDPESGTGTSTPATGGESGIQINAGLG